MITDTEVSAIVHLRQAFDKPMHELRSALDTCDDGCPNQHNTSVVHRNDLGWDVMNRHLPMTSHVDRPPCLKK